MVVEDLVGCQPQRRWAPSPPGLATDPLLDLYEARRKEEVAKREGHTKISAKMVLGIITAIAACPAIIGTTEAVRQGQKKSAKEQHRGLKTNLIVSCYRPTRLGREISGGSVVLRNNKVRTCVI